MMYRLLSILLCVSILALPGCGRPSDAPTDEQLEKALEDWAFGIYEFDDFEFQCTIDKSYDGTKTAKTAYGFTLTATTTDKHKDGAGKTKDMNCIAVQDENGEFIAIVAEDELFTCN